MSTSSADSLSLQGKDSDEMQALSEQIEMREAEVEKLQQQIEAQDRHISQLKTLMASMAASLMVLAKVSEITTRNIEEKLQASGLGMTSLKELSNREVERKLAADIMRSL